MVQRLEVHTGFAEDLRLVPFTHIVIEISLPTEKSLSTLRMCLAMAN